MEYKQNTRLLGGLLHSKQQLNELVTINAVYKRLEESGRLTAVSCKWDPSTLSPHPSWDSDVAKWVEGACEILKRHYSKGLRERVEAIIDDFIANQREDGYFCSYYLVAEPEGAFSYRPAHELYCAGHWFEAAVAHYTMSGERRFLEAAMRFADHINDVFVVKKSAKFSTPYHPEIELALVKLYRCTGEERFLELAKHFVDKRGTVCDVNDKSEMSNEPMPVGVPPQHNQSHMPAREQKTAVGHAVCASYFYSGMADVAAETDDGALFDACTAIFDDIYEHKMYITGGTGSTGYGESYTLPYDLPNQTAYCETCAAIAFIMFAERMLRLKKDSRYADAIERTLYNAMLSGVSLSGDSFFYVNPLELNTQKFNRHRNSVTPKGKRNIIGERAKEFNCFCCPPNVNRFLAGVDELLYMEQDGNVYVNQFAESEYKNGEVYVSQKTNYPQGGKISLSCKGVKRLFVRVPFWCDQPKLDCAHTMKGGYAVIEDPTEITVDFVMIPQFYRAHTNVRDNYGKVALMNGPIVYCVEGVDNGDIYSLSVDTSSKTEVVFNEKFGMNEIHTFGNRYTRSKELYSSKKPDVERIQIKFVPYSVFANRGITDMLVWIEED